MRTEINYPALEEELNELRRDPRIRKRLTALTDFICERLGQRSEDRLRRAGFDDAMKKGFLTGDSQQTKALYALLTEKGKDLGFSLEALKRLKRTAKQDRAAALEELAQELLEAKKIRFRKEAGIDAKIWIPIINNMTQPGDATLEKISNGLALSEEDRAFFRGLVIASVFSVTNELRDDNQDYRKRTGMTLTDFLNYAVIGKDAWEAFYLSKTEPGEPKKTSQETLLKLVIGFGLDEPEAWAFLARVESGFVLRRDLVFLACIRQDHNNPLLMPEILDFFGTDRWGQKLYSNPYR